MSDPKPSKPILRRSTSNTKVPTILAVPDLRTKSSADPDPIVYQSLGDVDPISDSTTHVDVCEDSQTLPKQAEEQAIALAELSDEPLESLVMDDLAAAAELTDDELTTPRSLEAELESEQEPTTVPRMATVSPSESAGNWFKCNLRRDMGTIATIAATVVACTLVAQLMKPNSTSYSLAQADTASVEETQPQLSVESPQNPQTVETIFTEGSFAQTPVQQPVGTQPQQQFNQEQLTGQLQSRLGNARNAAQGFIDQGVEAFDQQTQGVTDQVSAGVAANLPQGELPSLPKLNAPAIQQNLRDSANQVSRSMQFQTPQQIAANPPRPTLETPNNLNAPTNLNAPSNAPFSNAPQVSWPNQSQQQPPNNAVGQPVQTPTAANPADYPAHLFPNNAPQNQIIDPTRSANRFQAESQPRTAQAGTPAAPQASAYPTTSDPSLEELAWRLKQQKMARQTPTPRVADQRGVNSVPNNTLVNPNQNRFEANTYQNGNQSFPGGVNP